jgi:DNA-binding NtrC family response regulator
VSDRATVPHRSTAISLNALRVEVVGGPDEGKSHISGSDVITVGTAPGNVIVLEDETVSRHHLELTRSDEGIVAVDHGSTNGTFVGTTRIQRAIVRPGTLLALGKTTVRVDDGDPIAVEMYDDDQYGRLRGRSPEMRRLMALIDRAAKSDASVLILGETGTGKELIARAIHEASGRADQPFETVDCGAQLPTLIASELFGHERGAFTGAERQHLGAFERANGGTLFLDEIGELPLALQPMLLGALERRQIRRVGASKAMPIDVRFISATNRDLREEVNSGQFRQDLYYRVGVVQLRVPPLRERRIDIPILVEHFLREAGYQGEVEDVISSSAMQALKEHRWPGNVRELRNFVEAAHAMGEAPHLDSGPRRTDVGTAATGSAIALEGLIDLPYSDARTELLDGFERVYLERLIARANGNVSEASRLAKINRGYLNTLLKKHGLRKSD